MTLDAFFFYDRKMSRVNVLEIAILEKLNFLRKLIIMFVPNIEHFLNFYWSMKQNVENSKFSQNMYAP